MAKTYFRHGGLVVTSELVKARNRSIQLATLESVEISRKLFFSALALAGGMVGFALVFGDLLYPVEWVALVAIGAGLLVLSWNVGTFTIYSKLTGAKGWSVTGWIGVLHRMRAAVEEAIEERDARGGRGRNRGGAVPGDDDDADEA